MTGAKLDALVIWPNAGKIKLKCLYPANIYIHHRVEGSWMDTKVMEIWVRHCLRPYALKLPKGKKGLLILDNFSGHVDKGIEEKIKELNFDILRLPPNTTGYLQPLDLAINKPFKNYFSDLWEAWISSDNPHPLTKKARNFEKPTREQTITWISKAWTLISSDLVQTSFSIYKPELQEPQNQEIEGESTLQVENPEIIEIDFDESDNDEETDDEDDHEFCDASNLVKKEMMNYVIEIDNEDENNENFVDFNDL